MIRIRKRLWISNIIELKQLYLCDSYNEERGIWLPLLIFHDIAVTVASQITFRWTWQWDKPVCIFRLCFNLFKQNFFSFFFHIKNKNFDKVQLRLNNAKKKLLHFQWYFFSSFFISHKIHVQYWGTFKISIASKMSSVASAAKIATIKMH